MSLESCGTLNLTPTPILARVFGNSVCSAKYSLCQLLRKTAPFISEHVYIHPCDSWAYGVPAHEEGAHLEEGEA